MNTIEKVFGIKVKDLYIGELAVCHKEWSDKKGIVTEFKSFEPKKYALIKREESSYVDVETGMNYQTIMSSLTTNNGIIIKDWIPFNYQKKRVKYRDASAIVNNFNPLFMKKDNNSKPLATRKVKKI